MTQEKEYFAFISYQRKDEEWADRLRSKLEHYRLPSSVRKQDASLPQEIRPIFRDALELAGGVLAKEIETALQNSKFLIVICSPNSAKSPWVNKEIQTFIDLGREDRIIPFIIDGTPFSDNRDTECFPPALRSLKGEKELLGININELGRDAASIKVVARMFGLKFDTLWQRYEREKKKKRWMMTSGVLLLALAAVVTASIFFNLNQKLEKANYGMRVSLSRILAEKASALVDEGDSYSARLLALSAIENALTPQAEASLRLAMSYESAKLFEVSVRYATFSPDGKLLATASCHIDSPGNTSIKIWDGRNGSVIQTFGKSKEIDHVDFSADGNYIVSASRNDTISLWDIKRGEEIRSFSGHKSCVKSAIFSSNGEKILSASRDGTAKLWNVKTGKEIRTFSGHTAYVMSAQFSPDETHIVTASGDSTIKIWNALDGKEIRTLKGHKGSVYNALYSKDGEYIISCSLDNTIRIWNAQTGDAIKTLTGHTMGVLYLSISHNGKLLASASRDRTIKIWDLQTGVEIRTISGHYDWVNSVEFSPNDSLLISAADDNVIKIWDLYPNECDGCVYIKSCSFANSACYSPNGRLLAIACGDSVKIHDIKTGVEIGNYTHSGEVKSVCFSSNGKYVVSGSFSAVKVWNISTKEITKTLDYKGIDRVSISPDGKYIVSAQGLVWNLETGDTIGVLRGHRSHTYSEEFSSDGKMIVTASHDRTVRIWDVATRKELNCLRGHTNQVLYASFSPDMKQIVSACGDGQIKQWNAQTGEEIRSLDGHRGMVECVSFSSDNKTIVSASWDGTVKIWDAATGCLLKTLQGHKGILTSAMFSPDCKQIVSTSQDGTVRIWNFPPIQQLIDETRERFKNRKLTSEERRKYYLDNDYI